VDARSLQGRRHDRVGRKVEDAAHVEEYRFDIASEGLRC
jgi:hypothetical protein